MAALPAGIVTFLFTDIEGSTRLWERDRAEMTRAARRHDAILDAAILEPGHTVRVGPTFSTAGSGSRCRVRLGR
jgi:class 3 adenylate cyclase